MNYTHTTYSTSYPPTTLYIYIGLELNGFIDVLAVKIRAVPCSLDHESIGQIIGIRTLFYSYMLYTHKLNSPNIIIYVYTPYKYTILLYSYSLLYSYTPGSLRHLSDTIPASRRLMSALALKVKESSFILYPNKLAYCISGFKSMTGKITYAYTTTTTFIISHHFPLNFCFFRLIFPLFSSYLLYRHLVRVQRTGHSTR